MTKYNILNSLKQLSLTLTMFLGIGSLLNASEQAQHRVGQIADEHSKLVCLVLAEAKFIGHARFDKAEIFIFSSLIIK